MTKTLRLNLFAGLYGNTFAHFNNILTLCYWGMFSHLFFLSLTSAYSGLVASCLIRILGAIAFGYYGDKLGRRIMLITSASLMTLSTLCIAFLPAYYQIGIAAPILFVLLTAIQSFAMAGELPLSAIYVIESTRDEKKGLVSSLVFTTFFLGIVAGIVTVALTSAITPQDYTFWVWRLVYGFAAIFSGIGIYLRIRSKESPDYANNQTINSRPLDTLFTQRWLALLLVTILVGVFCRGENILHVYTVKGIIYSTQSMIALIPLLSIIMLILLIAFMGHIADTVGFRKVFTLGLCVLTLFTIPLSALPIDFLYEGFVFALLFAAFYATLPLLIAAMFPTNIRASGICMGYNLGWIFFGGTYTHLMHTYFHFHTTIPWQIWSVSVWSGIAIAIFIKTGKLTQKDVRA